MKGAFVGDFVGSRFEFFPNKTKDFDLISEGCHPTDDTILTIAVGDALAHGKDIGQNLRDFGLSFPTSYGMHFRDWMHGNLGSFDPYGSWANGAAMRVSCAAWLATSFEQCMEFAERSAAVTHNHPEGIRAAKAVAAAIYAGLSGWKRNDIRAFIQKSFQYDLSASVEELMPASYFELKAWVSIPKALICAFEAETVEGAVRNAVYLGGDADTEAAIAGSVAETWSEPPRAVLNAVWRFFPPPLQARVNSIQAKIDGTVREPLTKNQADSYVGWDPNSLTLWENEMAIRSDSAVMLGRQEAIAKLNAITEAAERVMAEEENSQVKEPSAGKPSLLGSFLRRIFKSHQ